MINTVFGRYFWVWGVVFWLSASYLSARSVSAMVRLWLPTELYAPAGGSGDDDRKRLTASTVLKSLNIMDPNNQPVQPVTRPKPAERRTKPKPRPVVMKNGCPQPQAGQKIPETKMRRLRLKGTNYVESDPDYSTAAIYTRVKVAAPVFKSKKNRRRRRRTTRRVEIFRVGDLLHSKAMICAIERQRVLLFRRGKLEYLSLNPKRKKKRKLTMYGSIGMILDQPKGDGEIRPDATDKFTIKRSMVQDWLNNPMKYAMSARIMPVVRGGKSAGIRLVWVRPGSLYAKLGLKSGDVVQQVNGKTLSIGNALGLYSKLPNANNLKVNIIRRGSRRSINYNIK